MTTCSLLIDLERLTKSLVLILKKPSYHPPLQSIISTWLGNYATKKITDNVDYSASGLVVIKQYSGGSVESWRWWSYPISQRYYTDSSVPNAWKNPGNGLQTLDVDGYTLGSDSAINNSTVNQIGYGFKPCPEVFDVQTYNTPGSNTHNLGVTPEVCIAKSTVYNDWYMYHQNLGQNQALRVNQAQGAFTQSNIWGSVSTDWSDTKYYVAGNAFAGSSGTQHMAYLFASKPGVCKIGTYGGNGSNTPVRVECGSPGFVIIKGNNNSDWILFDMIRGDTRPLYLDLTNPQGYFRSGDYESDGTGFSIKGTSADLNHIGVTYFYIALIAQEGQT